jgi:TonB family protein
VRRADFFVDWRALPSRRFRSLRLAALVAFGLPLLAPGGAGAQLGQPLPPPPGPEAAPPPPPKLTKPPAIIKNVEPEYPPEAFAAGLTGDVTLGVDLDADGHVIGVAVTQGAGHGFDEAAVAAVKQMEFSPAEVDGKPAAVHIAYTLHFKPKVVETPPPEEPPPEEEAPPPPALPPPVVVRGHMREKGTREPVVGADVVVTIKPPAGTPEPKPEVVGSTDSGGMFEVRAAAPDGLRVVVSSTGHEPCIRDFTAAEVSGAAPAEWTCFARSRAQGLYETHVRATSRPEEMKTTLSKAELTTVPGTLGDPLRVIQNLPGVARSPYGLGLLIVRGANPADTGVFIDGLNVPLLYHFLVGPSVLAPSLVDKIDFFPGGFGARYGRFSGGLVDVSLRSEVGKELHGSADISLLDASASFEGPLRDGVRASVAVRRSYIDKLLPYFIPNRVGSTFVTAVPVYYDYQARVEKDLKSGGRVSLEAFGSDDDIAVVAQDPTRKLDLNNHTASHRVMATLVGMRGRWVAHESLAYGYGVQSFSAGPNTGAISYDRLFLREDLSRAFGPRFTLATGLDAALSYDLADFDSPFPRDGRSIGISTPEQINVRRRLFDTAPAVYVEGQWAPLPSLRLVPGLRFDYYHVVGTDKFSVDPRFSGRLALNPSTALKATVGLYHQLPTGQFLDKEFGNPNLALIWADQYELGVERRFTRAVNLTVTSFFVRRHDIPVPSIDHYSSLGLGRAYGLEVLLRHEITEHFFGWIAYTLSWSEEAGTPALGVPMGPTGMERNGADLTYHPGPFDQRHNLILIGSYRWRSWELGARYRLVTGVPITPVTGSFYDVDFNGYTRLNGPTNSGRNPTFSQLDLRLEHTWTFNYWVLGVYLEVQNVTNAENPEAFTYDYNYQQTAPVRGLPIFPVLGVRGRF